MWAFCTSIHGLGLSEERFWDLTLAEFSALTEVRAQSQKDAFLGFQFVATIIARCHGNDVDFMPTVIPERLISLDDAEGWFKSMAEGGKAKVNGKPQELGD